MASRNRVWIRLDTVYAIHEAQISEHGGLAGIRSPDGLESALERPRHADAYETPRPDVPTLAARYAIAIVSAHPFLDGNERVGFVILELVLEANGFSLIAKDDEATSMMWALDAGTTSTENKRAR